MANLWARHAIGGYFTNGCCQGRSPGLRAGLLDVWTIFKVNLSKISISKNSGHKILLIHTTNDIPLPHHPSTLGAFWKKNGQVLHPTLALGSPTWDPGERPYDHGSSWPHPLPSKHKDDEIWDDFRIYPYHILTHVHVQLSAVQMFKSPCPNQQLLDKTTQMMLRYAK